MKHEKTLLVEKVKALTFEKYCREPSAADCGRGEIIFDSEVEFDNGYCMVIQVIASESPEDESCWTQGVLFDENGCELGCTDVGETFLGEYCVSDLGDDYVVEVKCNNSTIVLGV
jgi:hypothetical protein